MYDYVINLHTLSNLNLKPKYYNTIKEILNYLIKSDIIFDYIGLFGSCARGKTMIGSDVDIILTCDCKIEREYKNKLFSEIDNIAFENGCEVDIVFSTSDLVNHDNSIFYKEIRKDLVKLAEKRGLNEKLL